MDVAVGRAFFIDAHKDSKTQVLRDIRETTEELRGTRDVFLRITCTRFPKTTTTDRCALCR